MNHIISSEFEEVMYFVYLFRAPYKLPSPRVQISHTPGYAHAQSGRIRFVWGVLTENFSLGLMTTVRPEVVREPVLRVYDAARALLSED